MSWKKLEAPRRADDLEMPVEFTSCDFMSTEEFLDLKRMVERTTAEVGDYIDSIGRERRYCISVRNLWASQLHLMRRVDDADRARQPWATFARFSREESDLGNQIDFADLMSTEEFLDVKRRLKRRTVELDDYLCSIEGDRSKCLQARDLWGSHLSLMKQAERAERARQSETARARRRFWEESALPPLREPESVRVRHQNVSLPLAPGTKTNRVNFEEYPPPMSRHRDIGASYPSAPHSAGPHFTPPVKGRGDTSPGDEHQSYPCDDNRDYGSASTGEPYPGCNPRPHCEEYTIPPKKGQSHDPVADRTMAFFADDPAYTTHRYIWSDPHPHLDQTSSPSGKGGSSPSRVDLRNQQSSDHVDDTGPSHEQEWHAGKGESLVGGQHEDRQSGGQALHLGQNPREADLVTKQDQESASETNGQVMSDRPPPDTSPALPDGITKLLEAAPHHTHVTSAPAEQTEELQAILRGVWLRHTNASPVMPSESEGTQAPYQVVPPPKNEGDALVPSHDRQEPVMCVVPTNHGGAMLSHAPDSPVVGHRGCDPTLQRHQVASEPSLTINVNSDVQGCLSRRQCQPTQPLNLAPLQGRGVAFSWSSFKVNHAGLVPKSPQAKGYLITVSGTFAKWVERLLAPNDTAVATAVSLLNHVFSRWGLPVSVDSDRGTHFIASVMTALCGTPGSEGKCHTSHHLQSSGLVERVNQSVIPHHLKAREQQWPGLGGEIPSGVNEHQDHLTSHDYSHNPFDEGGTRGERADNQWPANTATTTAPLTHDHPDMATELSLPDQTMFGSAPQGATERMDGVGLCHLDSKRQEVEFEIFKDHHVNTDTSPHQQLLVEGTKITCLRTAGLTTAIFKHESQSHMENSIRWAALRLKLSGWVIMARASWVIHHIQERLLLPGEPPPKDQVSLLNTLPDPGGGPLPIY